jgi:hypothetical protein
VALDPAVGAERAAATLRAGGRIALFWNLAEHSNNVQHALDAAYRKVAADLIDHSIALGRGANDRFPDAVSGLEASAAFESIERREYPWVKRYTTATWLDHLPTHSDHATLPAEQLDALLNAVGASIDRLGGFIDVMYRTVLITARRRPQV